MSTLLPQTFQSISLPAPRVEGGVRIRTATMDDLPFIDALQKQNTKALGYFPRGQFVGYIEMGAVVLAEGVRDDEARPSGSATGEARAPVVGDTQTSPAAIALPHGRASSWNPLGYIISRDRYLKRDELGIVYQLCVVPGVQRRFVGAALLKEAFERSAYGCKLYCCWCAQDLAANYFWESMGFVPLAFRAGGKQKGKGRVHILWQKRINEGDEQTAWWYPFQTNAGAIRQDRLVFPIPPGTHWTEVQAVAVPTLGPNDSEPRTPVSGSPKRSRKKTPPPPPPPTPMVEKVAIYVGGKIRYIERPMNVSPFQAPPLPPPPPPPPPPAVKETAIVLKKAKAVVTIDPAFLRANRELRDRYLEHLNAEPELMMGAGKYEASRVLPEAAQVPRLAA